MTETVEVTDPLGVFRASAYETPNNRFIVNFYRVEDGHSLTPQRWLNRLPTEDELVAVLNDWIYEKAGSKPPEPKYCTACEKQLTPDKANPDTDYQFQNVLWVEFHGGYAMFIDPMPRSERDIPKAVLCHECAHEMCEQHAWMNRLLQPAHGHSHPLVDHARLEDEGHVGWDLNKKPLTRRHA